MSDNFKSNVPESSCQSKNQVMAIWYCGSFMALGPLVDAKRRKIISKLSLLPL